jgi:hypothetical protein
VFAAGSCGYGSTKVRGASEGEPEGEPLSERREIGRQLVR